MDFWDTVELGYLAAVHWRKKKIVFKMFVNVS